MSKWTSRVITDMVGEAGRGACCADWLDAGYEAWIMDALTGSEITYEDREVALAGYGLVVEFND